MAIKIVGATFKQVKWQIQKFKDPQKFLEAVKQKLLASFKLGFRNSESPDGEKWAGITHRQGQPLRDTGRLQQSITAKLANGKITIGTNLEYAAMQQFGSTEQVSVPAHVKTISQAFGKPLKFPVNVNVKAHTKKLNVKARPFLGFGTKQQQIVNKLFAKWADGALN